MTHVGNGLWNFSSYRREAASLLHVRPVGSSEMVRDRGGGWLWNSVSRGVRNDEAPNTEVRLWRARRTRLGCTRMTKLLETEFVGERVGHGWSQRRYTHISTNHFVWSHWRLPFGRAGRARWLGRLGMSPGL